MEGGKQMVALVRPRVRKGHVVRSGDQSGVSLSGRTDLIQSEIDRIPACTTPSNVADLCAVSSLHLPLEMPDWKIARQVRPILHTPGGSLGRVAQSLLQLDTGNKVFIDATNKFSRNWIFSRGPIFRTLLYECNPKHLIEIWWKLHRRDLYQTDPISGSWQFNGIDSSRSTEQIPRYVAGFH